MWDLAFIGLSKEIDIACCKWYNPINMVLV